MTMPVLQNPGAAPPCCAPTATGTSPERRSVFVGIVASGILAVGWLFNAVL